MDPSLIQLQKVYIPLVSTTIFIFISSHILLAIFPQSQPLQLYSSGLGYYNYIPLVSAIRAISLYHLISSPTWGTES
ncbi:hypothetical protein M431DRAFT_453900 [Trichoderma harzianum CBS 226.95]|uniref:Uncharacterized protein n=1 Tax=Trichoderma harzianum CBS 226.95 TaxID=983964 RepID=A0A2T4ABH5_TRIHA|nr:hypothetical protein M431DRAFT_453900 [Trichoderma harzianum CBS 226.95]PTB54268.1 hypothetical protein M431DRAFT_453900 [Trichoderma harzianum CBS 226.95]